MRQRPHVCKRAAGQKRLWMRGVVGREPVVMALTCGIARRAARWAPHVQGYGIAGEREPISQLSVGLEHGARAVHWASTVLDTRRLAPKTGLLGPVTLCVT